MTAGVESGAPAVRRRGPGRYLLVRAGEYVVVLAVAVTINFLLPRTLPGGPLATIAGENAGALSSDAQRRALEQYGLDRPLLTQLADYVTGLFRLDLGESLEDGRPVAEVIGTALPWTLLLVGTALLLAAVLGVALGALAGVRRRRGKGSALLSGVLLADSTPPFFANPARRPGLALGEEAHAQGTAGSPQGLASPAFPLLRTGWRSLPATPSGRNSS